MNVKPFPGQYVTCPDQLVLLPGVGTAVRRLNDTGRQVILVTNQRAVARGLMSDADLNSVHRRLRMLLLREGAWLDATYSCVHQKDRCDCRKPLPGLFIRAAAEHPDIRLSDSIVIGDNESDVLAGKSAGTRAIRLATAGTESAADYVTTDLTQAVDWVLAAAS